jgi:hypothetical protein
MLSRALVNTEERHGSSMVRAAQMDAGDGKEQEIRVPRYFIGFSSRSMYLPMTSGLLRLRSYLLTPKMGWSRGGT